MADVIEALHNLARQRGRGDASPLLALRALPEREGARISHLSISQRLSQAWISLTGQPFRQHQSLSLSAMRRAEPFALIGGGPATRRTLHLLAFEHLRGEAQSTALILAPDADGVDL
ncbi:MAG: helicase, partial [Chloroflexales bacterium]